MKLDKEALNKKVAKKKTKSKKLKIEIEAKLNDIENAAKEIAKLKEEL